MNPGVLDHVLALTLVVAFPIYATRAYRGFMAAVKSGRPGLRLREYGITIALQWALVAAALLVWFGAGRSSAELGLGMPAGARAWLGLGSTVAVLGLLTAQWITMRHLEGLRLESVRAELAPVRDLLPQTDAEYRVFQALAVTAGICEELLYRGFLVAYAAAFVGLWSAVLVTAIVFGIAHSYQGMAGILKTGVIGILAGALYAATGSLLWPMILHAAVDLQGGAIGRRVGRMQEESPGV